MPLSALRRLRMPQFLLESMWRRDRRPVYGELELDDGSGFMICVHVTEYCDTIRGSCLGTGRARIRNTSLEFDPRQVSEAWFWEFLTELSELRSVLVPGRAPSHRGASLTAKRVLHGGPAWRQAVAPALQGSNSIWQSTVDPKSAHFSFRDHVRICRVSLLS